MSEKAVIQCPVCKLPNQSGEQWDSQERFTMECERCGGPFTITATAARTVEKRALSALLSAWLRDQTDAGRDVPEISSKNIDTILDNLPVYSVLQKQVMVLRVIARRSSYPGQTVRLLPATAYPLAWAQNENEFEFYVRTLEERGLLRKTDTDTRTISDLDIAVEVTSDGWTYLDEATSTAPFTEKVFVAMSFSQSMKPIWEDAIRPALSDAGYRPYRIDSDPHIDRIDAKIISEIRDSRFLLADVTEHKHGVYFEAGYALGIGLPVIWSVREDHLSGTHFDTRQYNHIVWHTADQLKEKLYFVVCAVIGKNK